MHEYIKDATVLGTHPVFGPGSNGVKHKAYILTPTNAKEKKFAEEFKKWLEQEEAHVFIMSPKKHDELMSVVLGLPHFLGLVACETLLEQKNFPKQKKSLAQPIECCLLWRKQLRWKHPTSTQAYKRTCLN